MSTKWTDFTNIVVESDTVFSGAVHSCFTCEIPVFWLTRGFITLTSITRYCNVWEN